MEKTRASRPKRQTALQANKNVTTPNPLPAAHERSTEVAPETNAVAGQKLFEAATKAYRKDDCRTALELFDRYLADNSNSPLAADANLYKAECYLKLSAQ
jgi:TolA-binding protein